ncbi:Hypothetical protein, putative [Bodo saltans]|uniref:Uncharacterized protein n=1 Tax=Bodo saltans TaxID=75058 RepID=A0A0S4JET9_BODSA|nr:Hypothetical protein, putative [Bodo saltans]|eukprot:CUG86897.1 Hypothetical protein, putative [Bodo saltans]
MDFVEKPLIAGETVENPNLISLAFSLPKPHVARKPTSASIHKLKHERSRTALPEQYVASSTVEDSQLASSSRLLHPTPGLSQYLHPASSVTCLRSMPKDLRSELDTWKTALPSFASMIHEVSKIAEEVLSRTLSSTETHLNARREAALITSSESVTAPFKEKMEKLNQRAAAAADLMEELTVRRVKHQTETQQFLENARRKIEEAKVKLEDFQNQERTGNDRIQALYARSREFRQIVATREDVEKSIGELLIANEALTKEKGDLVEKIRNVFDSIDPTVASIQEQKINTERRIHLLNNKRLTVLRQVNAETIDLERRDEELRELTFKNEELCNIRELWSAKVSAMEANALREYTPRPDWHSSANDTAPTPGVVADSIAPQIVASIDGVDVPPLSDFLEIKSKATSSQIVDAALKKLGSLIVNSKRSVDEYLRLSMVIQPVIRCGSQCSQDDTIRVDGELEGITVHQQHFSIIPVGLVLPPGLNFADCVSRLQVQGPIIAASESLLVYRNEKWSQAVTERQAISMMSALPQLTLSANVLATATTPLFIVSELLAKWCALAPERDPATGFGANLLSSLRHYHDVSPICCAAFGIIYGMLPPGFGDVALQHVNHILEQVDGGVSSSGTAMRAVMGSIGRVHAKDNVFGALQVQQAKFAMGADASATGALVKLSAVTEIVEQRKNSGLFIRCIFSQYLGQHEVVVSMLSDAIVEVGKMSPVIKLLVVSDAALKTKLDSMKWDADTTMASPGVRYGMLGGGSKRSFLGIINRNAVLESLIGGLTRYDGTMLRLFDEDVSQVVPSAIGMSSTNAAHGTASPHTPPKSKKIEYVAVDSVLQRLPSTLIRIGEK